MKEYAVVNSLLEDGSAPLRNLDQYYSVEISIAGLGVVYQFKIWQASSTSMFILVKENSCLLPFLKDGDRSDMKYYSTDRNHPYQSLKTRIGDIVRHKGGRLGGHCLVELMTMGENGWDDFCLPFRSKEGQMLPLASSLRKNSGN